MRLLLVEDDEIDAQAVQRELTSDLPSVGQLDVAGTLEEGLEKLAAQQYDAILVDLNLPDNVGLETAERIVASADDAAVIVLTGSNDDELGVSALSVGAEEYLSKDQLHHRVLARTVRYATERQRLDRERQEAIDAMLSATTHAQVRIARELHDGIGQLQSAAVEKAMKLMNALSTPTPPSVHEAQELVELLRQIHSEQRAAIQGLVPPELLEHGLPKALSRLAQRWNDTNGLSCECRVANQQQVLSEDVAVHLFRISQEALHNAVRHSGANQIRVSLLGNENLLKLQVEDNGSGFNSRRQVQGGRQLGLRSMAQRAVAIGGKLSIQSSPGRGTVVICLVPLKRKRQKSFAPSNCA